LATSYDVSKNLITSLSKKYYLPTNYDISKNLIPSLSAKHIVSLYIGRSMDKRKENGHFSHNWLINGYLLCKKKNKTIERIINSNFMENFPAIALYSALQNRPDV
jgi:hypothetical protein